MIKGFFLFILLSLSLNVWAINYPYIMRSPRGLLMGDAFTAVNDDEFTLFYNPASMSRHKHDITMYPVNPMGSVTNILSDTDKFEDMPETPQGVAEVLMDYPIHAGAQYAPGMKLWNFGINFIAVDRVDAVMKNQTHPMLDIDLRSDRGMVMGIGIPLGPNRISKKTGSGSQFSFGAGAKYLKRKGVKDYYSLSGTTVMDNLEEDELSEILKNLGVVQGQGWGFDSGFEYMVRSGPTKMVMGLAALDIGGTKFEVPENGNPQKRQVASIDQQINLGFALGQEYKFFHCVLSADIRALSQEMDMIQRTRLGIEIGTPVLRVLGGLNSGYLSYGAMLDLYLIKVVGGFYDVEMGTSYNQTKSKQALIYVSLFDFSFDA